MAYDFPNTPTIGQPYAGYVWDGEKWQVQGTAMQNAVRYDVAQGLTANQMSQGRANINVTKKNYIINGGMMVSQELGSTATTIYGMYPADQWMAAGNLAAPGAFSFAQVASLSPAGSPNRIRMTVTTAQPSPGGTQSNIQQKIEGFRSADLLWGTTNAKTITIQFGVRTSVAGTYRIAVFDNPETTSVSGFITIAAGEVNTDVVKSVTLAGSTSGSWNTNNTFGMELIIYQTHSSQTANLFATINNVFELFDVSLTEGSVAPPFQVPDYATELVLCQRYFYKGVPPLRGIALSTAAAGRMAAPHPVPMRAVPTVTLTAGLPLLTGVGTLSTITALSGSVYSTAAVLELDGTSSGLVTGPALVYQTGSGNLNVSARL